jgi:hypothetical protein
VSGHSVTLQETVAVSSAEINGATAFEVSGMTACLCSFDSYLPQVFFFNVLGSVTIKIIMYLMNLSFPVCWFFFMRLELVKYDVAFMMVNFHFEADSSYIWQTSVIFSY